MIKNNAYSQWAAEFALVGRIAIADVRAIFRPLASLRV
jgi:hypothetical protein